MNDSEESTSSEQTKQKPALISLKQVILQRQEHKKKVKKLKKAAQREQLINSESEDEEINPDQEGEQYEEEPKFKNEKIEADKQQRKQDK